MNIESYQYMNELVERVKEPLYQQLDEREQILLESYLVHKGKLAVVAFQLGISLPQASRVLKRIQFKAEAIH